MLPNNLKCSESEWKDFILETYIQRYSPGRARANRLINIANVITDRKLKKHEQLRTSCLILASNEIRSHCEDVNVYKALIKISDESDSKDLIEKMEREQRVKKQELDVAMNKAKSDRDQELLTKSMKGMGDYFFNVGDPAQSIKFYSLWKDSIATPPLHLDSSKLTFQATLKLVEASLLSKSLAVQLRHYVAIAQHLSKNEDVSVSSALNACLGLSSLSEDFKTSAKSFLLVRSAFPSWMDSFLTLHDVSVYTTLLSICCLSRKEMKEQLLDNESLMGVLDCVPLMRELLVEFYNLQLGSFVEKLGLISEFLSFDVNVGGMVLDELMQGCRLQVLRMLTSPYSSISLSSIASALNSTPVLIHQEIYQRISTGKMKGKLDGINSLFVSTESEEGKKEAFKKVSDLGKLFTKETEAMLLRVSLLENFCVYDNRDEERKEKKLDGHHMEEEE